MVRVLHGDVATECAQPGIEVLDVGLGEVAGELANEPLGRLAEQLQRSFFGATCADDVVVALHLVDEPRNLVIGVGHVDVGPHDHTTDRCVRAGATRRARTAVRRMPDEADPVD